MTSVLFITQSSTGKVNLDRLYQEITNLSKHQVDLKIINDQERKNLKLYFNQHIQLKKYQFVVIFIRLKELIKQKQFLKTIPNLVFFEHDACQNYIKSSKYFGKYQLFYQQFPHAFVIVSGYQLSKQLKQHKIAAFYMRKGCDTKAALLPKKPKSTPFSFVGSTKAKAYQNRRLFIEEISKKIPELTIKDNLSKKDYFELLSDSTFFLSPDVGFGEYMIKNFEAMAAGCILLAYDQGDSENKSLGFIDQKNIVLFKDLNGCITKYQSLKNNPQKCLEISQAASDHAKNYLDFSQSANDFSSIIHQLPKDKRPIDTNGYLKTSWFKSIFNSLIN